MTLFVSFLLLTLPIISNGFSLSHEKLQSTLQYYENELIDQVCGRDTVPGKVPFYASIELTGLNYKWCSGVLISNQWVLTAAYCTTSLFAPIRVFLGDEWNNETITVEKSCVHPDFDPRTQVHDIALLLLKEPVHFSRNIQPICLPEPGEDETFYGRHGTVNGFKKLDRMERKSPSNMQITTSPIIRSDDCGKSYAKFFRDKLFITNSLMCAGYSDDVKDVCFSRLGNPLMVKVEKHWVLAGISMNNIECERPGIPHMYRVRFARVEFYLDWIKATVH